MTPLQIQEALDATLLCPEHPLAGHVEDLVSALRAALADVRLANAELRRMKKELPYRLPTSHQLKVFQEPDPLETKGVT